VTAEHRVRIVDRINHEVRCRTHSFHENRRPAYQTHLIAPDGSIISDGSACVMSRGIAQRARIPNVTQLAKLIERMGSNQALGLGALRTDLPDQVHVVRKSQINGTTTPDIIARTANNILYRPSEPALALLDFDTKGMPQDVAAEISRRGGFFETLISVMPNLAGAARVTRAPTSAGLFRSDTGDRIPGSEGRHVYVLASDGADIERFLKALHDRCWLAGFGWMMVGAVGQLLDRSLIDRSVFGAERLVFEGSPVLASPLQQDPDCRRPQATEGKALDTVTTCPPLTIAETAKLNELKDKCAYELRPNVEKARSAFIKREAARIVERTGMHQRAAEGVALRHCGGILLPDVELPFDDPEFAGRRVGDVLADPDRFEGATLADPLEGIPYGTCKAKIMLGADGAPFIHSFAHGRTIYQLKADAAFVRAAMERAGNAEAAKVFVELAATADLDAQELEALRNEAAKRSGVGRRAIKEMLKAAERDRAARRAEQERERRNAQRTDPRPVIQVPKGNAPWLPVVEMLNGVLGGLRTAEPPLRDIDGYCTRTRRMQVPGTHAFTDSNPTEECDGHD
jgi:hypothetical protein